MVGFKLLDNTYYYGVDTSSFEMVETTSDFYDNYFPFPLNSNAYGGSEPFQVGGKFGINFESHYNSRVRLCDYKFTIDEDGTALWMQLVSTDSTINGIIIAFSSNEDLSCAGINQKIWNYLYKNKAGNNITTTNTLFNSITHIFWEEWELVGILDIYYKNTDEKILTTDIEYYGFVGDYCKVFSVYLNAYEEPLGLSTKSFSFRFNNDKLLGDYLLIPKLNKIKWLLEYIDEKVQPIFGPNSIDAILNRLTEKNTILISGQDITGNALTKTLLTFTDPNGEIIGIDYKVVPYGVNYTNSYGTVNSGYDLAFKQLGIKSYYLNYSSTNNAINTSGTGITLYDQAIIQPTDVSVGTQNVYVYIFDEDESRTYTNLTEFNKNSQGLVKTNFIPCYPTTLLHVSGTTLSDRSSGLLESISYGFRNNSVTYTKAVSLAQGNIKPTGMLSVTYTGGTFSLSAKKDNSWSVLISEMNHSFTLGTSLNGNAVPAKLNGRTGTTTTTVYIYKTDNSLIVSGSTTGKFSVVRGVVRCLDYAALSLSKISGNTTYNVVTKTILTFSPAYSQTANSYDVVSCTGSFNMKYTKPGLYFNFNVGSSAYSPVYYSGTTYYYPPLCRTGFRKGGKKISNGAITKEGFSFTSKKFLMVDGVPRACNNAYFLSGNMILLPSYTKGSGGYCLYIGARKITQHILDRSYGIHSGELTFTTDYVCSKSFKTSAWSSYTQSDISYNEIYSSSNRDETSYECYPSMVGRNLLRNTVNFTWGPSSSQYYYSAITPTIGFKPFTVYTFSAQNIRLSSGDTVTFAIFDSSIKISRMFKDFVIKKNVNSNKYSFNFRTTATVASTDKFLIYAGFGGRTSGVTLTMYSFKLEEGSCASDWSAAPEDSGAFLNMPFKCSDALATANDITEKICCLFAPSYRYNLFYKTGSGAALSNIYEYLLSKTNVTICTNIGVSGYIGKLDNSKSGSIGECFRYKLLDILQVDSSDTSLKKSLIGCYTSNEYNIRKMTYPTFNSPTATTITYVNGLCIPFAKDTLLIVNLSANYGGIGGFAGKGGLYYYDGCVFNNFGSTVSGFIGDIDDTSGCLGLNVILPNDANGSSINDMYLELIDESINDTISNSIVSGAIGSLGLVMCDKSEKIPTVERVFRRNTIDDIVSYQCYGIMKFDFDKMLYYMDTSVYIKIIDHNYSFNTYVLSEDFGYKIYFCNEQISSEIIYPLSYDTMIDTTHIKPTVYVTEDMAELNFRVYETNKIPFNATGKLLRIGFSFPLTRGLTLSYYETRIIDVYDILLQQGYTQQDDVLRYVPSFTESEIVNNVAPTLQYGTRASGNYSGYQTGLKLTCTTVSSTTANFGARWTASNLTKLKNLTGTSQSTCVKSGTSVITTAIIMGTIKTTAFVSANPLNYNSGVSPLAGTLNMQNKPIEVWYLMHAAVSNAPSGSDSYTSNYNGTTYSKSRMASNIYTTYLDTLPTYIFGGFRPADNTTYLLKNYLIKYLGISYLNDAGYNNLFQ